MWAHRDVKLCPIFEKIMKYGLQDPVDLILIPHRIKKQTALPTKRCSLLLQSVPPSSAISCNKHGCRRSASWERFRNDSTLVKLPYSTRQCQRYRHAFKRTSLLFIVCSRCQSNSVMVKRECYWLGNFDSVILVNIKQYEVVNKAQCSWRQSRNNLWQWQKYRAS